jgi:hypothetical protein
MGRRERWNCAFSRKSARRVCASCCCERKLKLRAEHRGRTSIILVMVEPVIQVSNSHLAIHHKSTITTSSLICTWLELINVERFVTRAVLGPLRALAALQSAPDAGPAQQITNVDDFMFINRMGRLSLVRSHALVSRTRDLATTRSRAKHKQCSSLRCRQNSARACALCPFIPLVVLTSTPTITHTPLRQRMICMHKVSGGNERSCRR